MDPTVRRAMILHAATEMFVQHGYEQVSVAMIAEQVQGSEALIYRYFPSKSELYDEVLQMAFGALFAAVEERLTSLPDDLEWTEVVRELSDASLDFFSSDENPLQTALLTAVGEPSSASRIRENWITYGMEMTQQVLPAEFQLSPVLMESSIASWVRSVFAWSRQGRRPEDRELINTAMIETLMGVQRALRQTACQHAM